MARDPNPSPAPNQGTAVWAWNGTEWEALLVDADGHLQLDVVSVAAITGSVSVSNFPATQPVSIASMPSTPVTGTFYPATQPVSIASMPSTPVTGTFYKVTQPVSIATMPSTPVTGTFWQTTQPISIDHQDITIDANNTYSGEIAGNATKTCNGTDATDHTAIQVYLKSDQNCTVYIDQADVALNLGGDGTITDSYNYYSTLGNGSYTVISAAPFYRVRVKNLSASTANVILASAMIPALSALPRSLDDEGYLKTGIKSIRGQMGRVRVSPMGALKTAASVRLAGHSFIGGTVAAPIALDATSWVTAAVGSGAVTQGGGEATLTTAATLNSSCLVTSVRTARYVGGNPNYYRGNLRLPAVTTATAGFVNIRRWGAFDANNGYFFRAIQTNPATTPTLSVVSRKETSDTNVTSFNGDYGTTFPLDNLIHTYEIWWSNKKAYFFIDDILLHTITASTTTNVGTPSLKVGLQTINSGDNTAANTLVALSSMIIRLGNLQSQTTSYYYASGTTAGTQVKTGAGNIHSIIFGGAANNSVVTLVDNTADSTPVIWLYTATGALASPVSIDLKGLPFSTGLRFVVGTGNASFTIVYE